MTCKDAPTTSIQMSITNAHTGGAPAGPSTNTDNQRLNDNDRLWPFEGIASTFRRKRGQGGDLFRVMHLNATSARRLDKRALIFNELSRLDLDCLVVTETWWSAADERAAGTHEQIRGRYTVYPATTEDGIDNHHGVAIVLAKEWARHVQEVLTVPQRMVGVRLAFRGRGLLLIGVLYPTGKGQSDPAASAEIREKMAAWIEEARRLRAEVLVGGDFNAVPQPWLDRAGGEEARAESPLLTHLLRTCQMRDTWRDQFPVTRQYTNTQATAQGVARARLDLFLATPMLAAHVTGAGIGDGPDQGSDGEAAWPVVDHYRRARPEPAPTPVTSTHQAIFVEVATTALFARTPPEPTVAPGRKAFRLQGVDKARWEAYTTATDTDVPRRIKEATRETPDGRRLRHDTLPHLSRLWMAIKEHLLVCAEATLPTVKRRSGRRGKPPVLLPLLQAARGLARLQRADIDDTERARRLLRLAGEHRGVSLLAEAAAAHPFTLTSEQARQLRTQAHNRGERELRERQRDSIRASLERRERRFHTHLRDTIASVLERKRPPAPIDVVRTGPGTLEDRPAKVRQRVRKYFRAWMAERRGGDPLGHPTWRRWYEPRGDVDHRIYDGVMAPIAEEEMDGYLKQLPCGKAPGASGVVNELLSHAGTTVRQALAALMTACLRRGDIPDAWKHGVIHPIPKTPTWCGDLGQLRPITLLETPRKLLSLVLTRRLQDAIERHGVLLGGNYGFTRGRRTTDFVQVLRAAIDDAQCSRRGIEVLMLDVRRAYDSVSWCSLACSLRRIRVPEAYIGLLERIFDKRTATVRTHHGQTQPHHPECGLDQGEVNSPLLWLVFYDTLLCALRQSKRGYKMAWPDMEDEMRPVRIAYGAFADDLTLVAETRADLQGLASICRSFFALHDIEVHCGKTVHAAKTPPGGAALPLPMVRLADGDTGLVQRVLPATEPFRLLGAWLTLDGRSGSIRDKISTSIAGICRLLWRKSVSSDIAVYIVNAVLLPAVTHRACAATLSTADCEAIDRSWLRLVKRKAHLAVSCPNDLVWASAGLGVTRTQDALDATQIADLCRRLDDRGILGRSARSQEQAAKRYARGSWSPYERYSPHGHSDRIYALHLARRIQARGAQLVRGRDGRRLWQSAADVPIQAAATGQLYRSIRTPCHKRNRLFLRHLLRYSPTRSPRPWRYSVLAGRKTPKKGQPRWYRDLENGWRALAARAQTLSTATRTATEGPAAAVAPLTAEQLSAVPRDPAGTEQDWAAAVAGVEGTVVVWTDGSVLHPLDEERRRGGYAAVILAPTDTPDAPAAPAAVAAGRYEGPHCHSDMLEALAVAHALHCLPEERDIEIRTDSATCVKWWRHYVASPVPWEAAWRRRTPTHKVWEVIAERTERRTGGTAIRWVKAHAGTAGNELADGLAKAAAHSTTGQLPVWSLNTSLAPVTRRNLLFSGVNLLLPPLAVLKRQARARHAVAIRRRLIERHPSLADRLPAVPMAPLAPIRRQAAGEAGGGGAAAAGAASAEDATRRREFALKLAMDALPTLTRQHRWHPRLYPDPRCPRCDTQTPEDWTHLTRCPANAPGVGEAVREAGVEAAMAEVHRVNEARAEEEPPRPPLRAGEVAFAAMPSGPPLLHDIGHLLGLPDPAVKAALKGLGLRQEEASRVLGAATDATLAAVHALVWRPRCKDIEERLGSWKGRREEARRTTTTTTTAAAPSDPPTPRPRVHPPPQHAPPPATAAAAAPPSGWSGDGGGGETRSRPPPAADWADINRIAFHVERIRPRVEPAWCP